MDGHGGVACDQNRTASISTSRSQRAMSRRSRLAQGFRYRSKPTCSSKMPLRGWSSCRRGPDPPGREIDLKPAPEALPRCGKPILLTITWVLNALPEQMYPPFDSSQRAVSVMNRAKYPVSKGMRLVCNFSDLQNYHRNSRNINQPPPLHAASPHWRLALTELRTAIR